MGAFNSVHVYSGWQHDQFFSFTVLLATLSSFAYMLINFIYSGNELQYSIYSGNELQYCTNPLNPRLQ